MGWTDSVNGNGGLRPSLREGPVAKVSCIARRRIVEGREQWATGKLAQTCSTGLVRNARNAKPGAAWIEIVPDQESSHHTVNFLGPRALQRIKELSGFSASPTSTQSLPLACQGNPSKSSGTKPVSFVFFCPQSSPFSPAGHLGSAKKVRSMYICSEPWCCSWQA